MPLPLGLPLWVISALPLQGQPAPPSPITVPDPIVITANITERRGFDAPFGMSVIGAEELRHGGLMVNLSEALNRVPGLVVNPRGNYAQDLQVSSRGFGARAGFGVRGIRLYSDGIPATMPDGQGQVTHFDLAGAQRVEVLRGPFSALWGSSSGGVISLVSAPPTQRSFHVDTDVGSNGTQQVRLGAEAPLGGGWDLRVQGSHFETEGPRPHGEARRDLANVRLGWHGTLDTVTVLLNAIDQPAQDPLGLSRAQFDAGEPRTTPQALQFDTRKTAAQTQLGVQWKHQFDGGGALQSSQVMAYAGQRSVTQWLSIPVAVQQASDTHPGGVVDFDRRYQGVDMRLNWLWMLDDGRSARLVAGVSAERQGEDRRGFENFVTSGSTTQLGITGALRRDEESTARTSDVYAQGELDLSPDVTATVGARSGVFKVGTRDFYIAGANGDDSGDLSFRYTTPVAALQWRASPSLNLYASAGRGFESPTLAELAYGPQPGFNRSLQPQRSRQVEVGAKWRDEPRRLWADVAVFHIATRDEIGVLANSGGRSTYQNVGRTTRRGVEFAGQWQPLRAWRTQVALTWLDARYRDSFSTPGGTAGAGSRIAGTVGRSLFAELAWQATPATELAAEFFARGDMPVNDLNNDFAAGAGVWALRVGHAYKLPTGTLKLLARLDNAFDRRYAGSVIVNESNGRYFEPAAGRTWLLGAKWNVPF